MYVTRPCSATPATGPRRCSGDDAKVRVMALTPRAMMRNERRRVWGRKWGGAGPSAQPERQRCTGAAGPGRQRRTDAASRGTVKTLSRRYQRVRPTFGLGTAFKHHTRLRQKHYKHYFTTELNVLRLLLLFFPTSLTRRQSANGKWYANGRAPRLLLSLSLALNQQRRQISIAP